MKTFPILFAANKNGKIKTWAVVAEGATITVEHGQSGGKLQRIITKAKPKNVGKSNATTAEEQAVIEAKAKWVKQFDKKYRRSIKEAIQASEETLLPMLAHDYTKVGHRIKFPCYVSPKLDGLRCIAKVSGDKVEFHSRGGKQYPVPEHLKEALVTISSRTKLTVFDGELYIHGLSLQNITSCVKKHNENTPNLKFMIFDIPSDAIWDERLVDLTFLTMSINNPNINVVNNFLAESEEIARGWMDHFISNGYEGLMLRNIDGKYEWGNRSGDLQKWKDFQDIEAMVVDVEEDSIGEGVLLCRLVSGVTVRCKMRGTHEERLYLNQTSYIGSWVNIRFQAYTDDGSLQFPVATGIRKCDNNGNPLE